jgi:hypothetical protein
MTTPPAAPPEREALLDATTTLLGLAPETARRAQVLMHMGLIAQAAHFLHALPLDDATEQAPVFGP